MKKRFAVFASFFASLCALCSFLALALLLGSMAGCSDMGDAAVTPPPPPASSLEPSDQPGSGSAEPLQSPPVADAVTPSSIQPSAEQPPVRNTPAPEPASVPPSPVPASQDNSGNGFYAVLQGKADFYSTDAAQSLPISELSRAVSDDSGITAKALKFTMTDLDGDGVWEVVLWLQVNENDAYGFEVLRQQNGQIYGYTLPYRSFI